MTLYTQTARFDVARPMTEDEIRKVAPSVFATEAHESRSERFAVIPTIEVLRGLAKEGFHVVGAKQSGTRDPGRQDFTKHLLRLRRFDNPEAYKVGDTVFEMLLKNANDGTCRYNLLAALYRILCMNSMVAHIGAVDSVTVGHRGDAVSNVIEGTYRVLGTSQLALAAPQDWGNVKLDKDESQALAEAAHILRFGDSEGNVSTHVKPEQLLGARRLADKADDLWTKFNVVQENCIRGGIGGQTVNANGQRRWATSRPVNSIDQDVKLNKALWTLGEKMAELKGVKKPALEVVEAELMEGNNV